MLYLRSNDEVYFSEDGSGWEEVGNPFTDSEKSKLAAIEAQATRNSGGDGIDESSNGAFSVNDAYIEGYS